MTSPARGSLYKPRRDKLDVTRQRVSEDHQVQERRDDGREHRLERNLVEAQDSL